MLFDVEKGNLMLMRLTPVVTLALSVSVASRSRLCPDGTGVYLSGPAYMPSCIRPEVRLPFYQHVLCSDCCKNVLWLTQVLFSYFVLHRSKIPLVLTTKLTHLRSLLFNSQS